MICKLLSGSVFACVSSSSQFGIRRLSQPANNKKRSGIIEVDMFTNQKPSTKLTESTSENLSKKINFEKERLSKWL